MIACARLDLEREPAPCVSGTRFVSQEEGFTPTILDAIQFSNALESEYIARPSLCSMFRSAMLFFPASELV